MLSCNPLAQLQPHTVMNLQVCPPDLETQRRRNDSWSSQHTWWHSIASVGKSRAPWSCALVQYVTQTHNDFSNGLWSKQCSETPPCCTSCCRAWVPTAIVPWIFLAGEVEQPQPRHQQLEGALIRVKFYKVLYVPIGGPAHRCVGLSVAPANNSGWHGKTTVDATPMTSCRKCHRFCAFDRHHCKINDVITLHSLPHQNNPVWTQLNRKRSGSCKSVLANSTQRMSCLAGQCKPARKEFSICMKLAVLCFIHLELPE